MQLRQPLNRLRLCSQDGQKATKCVGREQIVIKGGQRVRIALATSSTDLAPKAMNIAPVMRVMGR